jgi:serine phosphatase RsbU (regulator of sigma subunit)
VAVAHTDPDREQWAWEVNRRYPAARDAPSGAANVIRTGQHELVNDISDAMLTAAAQDEDHLRLLRELGLVAALSAPLKVRGRTLGVLYLVSAESGRRFEPADVQLAIELGRRAGLAVENSRLFTARSSIAHTLQAELLPAELPEIPGFEIAARYRAAGEMNEVGGDFYDVFERPSGDWVAFVGDVSGKGAEAAAVTALARYTLRAAARQVQEPREILRLLNDAMLEQRGRRQFATVCLASMRSSERGAVVQLALGGHPPPLVLRAGGEVEAHGSFGTLLGLVPDPRLHHDELELGPGDLLLLYTDGVTEAGEQGRRIGQKGLAKALGLLRGKTADHVVRTIETVAGDAQSGAPRDDLALVALRVHPAP